MLVRGEQGRQVGPRQRRRILSLPLENIQCDGFVLLLALTQRLVLPQLLTQDLALLEGEDALKNVVRRKMNAAGGQEDAAGAFT